MPRWFLLGILLALTGCGGGEGGVFGNKLPDCRGADAIIQDPDFPNDPGRTFKDRVRVCRTSNSGWYVSPKFQ